MSQCETLLYIAYNLMNQNQMITVAALERNLEWLDCGKFNVAEEIARLIAGGLMTDSEKGFALTEQGKVESFRIHKERTKTDFNRLIQRYTDSAAYLDYCEEIYGYRMYLFNMMDRVQLDYLFNDVPVLKEDTILDLGCGSGSILNRLVTKYGCQGFGIDQLDPGIVSQNGSFSYICGDIDHFSEYRLQPDITLAIDSLYFSNDLERLLASLKGVNHNRLYLYYSQYIFDGTVKDKAVLRRDHTHLAQILEKNAFAYQTVDYSANEQALYENALQVLPKYQKAFASEGKIDLYEAKLKENKGGKELYDKGLASRYLYIVT